MPPLSNTDTEIVVETASSISLDEPAMRVEEFVSNVLGLNPAETATYLDDSGLATVIAELTSAREIALGVNGHIPSFVVFTDRLGGDRIAGLLSYLEGQGANARLLGRLQHHATVRDALVAMRTGHDLEALAAGMLDQQLTLGHATKGAGDQGIDAIGWSRFLEIDQAFVDGAISETAILPGTKVFALVSAKQYRFGSGETPNLISRAFIRELVGGWVIQRSEASKWSSVGLQMLSPVQLVLATTYRLSADAKSECRTLGVQVWGIPELVYMICVTAPESVFDHEDGHEFQEDEFRDWWQGYHMRRINVDA